MAYNNAGNNEGDGKVELWSRQNDVLKQLTDAEKLISIGQQLQNPVHDTDFGSKRNTISVTYMLQGCEGVLLVISPNIKDREKKEDGEEKKQGKESDTYLLYRAALNEAQKLINQSNTLGMNTVIGNKKLTKAYSILKEMALCLKNETHILGYDFKPKDNPDLAWQE